jgi:hypothetical protein
MLRHRKRSPIIPFRETMSLNWVFVGPTSMMSALARAD